MRLSILAPVFGVLLLTACGGSSPSSASLPTVPTSPSGPTTPAAVTITGHLTATSGGNALANVSVDLGGLKTVTAAEGTFSYRFQPGTTSRLTFSADSIVPRSLVVAISQTRGLEVDAIALGSGFDLAFYRRLIRNDYGTPGILQPLRRWTRTPSIYLKTVDEAGEAILPGFLDQVENTVKDAVTRWTGGELGTPTVERGTDSREGVSGWITIKYPHIGATDRCGQAQVAVDGGWIELEYHVPGTSTAGCRVPGYIVAPRTIRHEIGHALGLYHTGDPSDLMSGLTWLDYQANLQPTAHELRAVSIAYHRPIGNVDPDTDPSSSVNLAPLRIAIP